MTNPMFDVYAIAKSQLHFYCIVFLCFNKDYYSWLKKPNFIRYINIQTKRIIIRNMH